MSVITYIVFAAVAASVGTWILWRSHQRASRDLAIGYRNAFDEAFSALRPQPKLEVLQFVYPQFFVTFESERQRDNAKADGQLEAFTASIQSLCADQPRWGSSFRAELAIHYGYEGQFDARLAKWAAEEALRNRLFKQ